MALSFARHSELFAKNREIFIPRLYLAPPEAVIPSEFREGVWYSLKQNWCGEETMTMSSRFDRIQERDWRTDRQTDRIATSISRVCVLTRNKNSPVLDLRGCESGHASRLKSTWAVQVGSSISVMVPPSELAGAVGLIKSHYKSTRNWLFDKNT